MGVSSLFNTLQLNGEEIQVAKRIDNYFKCRDMSFREKVFHAMLITRHELEAHHYGNEYERQRVMQFARVLDGLLQKTV
jgi:hypothetical protein